MADTAHEHTESHGHSTAAWTGVTVIIVGSLIMSLAVVFPSYFWFGFGAVVVVLGVVAGKLMSMAGYGDKIPPLQRLNAGIPGPTGDGAPASQGGRTSSSSGGKSQHDSGIS